MSPALSHVGDQAKSGQHLLVSSLSHFDPSATSARLSVAVAKPSFSPIEVLVWADAIPSLGDREAPSITRGLELLLLNSSDRNEGVLE